MLLLNIRSTTATTKKEMRGFVREEGCLKRHLKNSRGCLQIPAAWRREGKCFCACVPSLKFPGGTDAEITQYKQEKE